MLVEGQIPGKRWNRRALIAKQKLEGSAVTVLGASFIISMV
jgi:hypothetical protein